MKFEGTGSYVATDDLKVAVNAAVTLERPLLVKGEPGTGKTELARQVASSLGLRMIEWNIKSTTRAQQGLYEYDAVSRLRDSQLGDARVHDVSNYIRKGKLWEAFEAGEKVVLLIDEIDKADIEFPNDLLQELDKNEFFVYETGETIKAKVRPIVIITSNNEKELPDAFLRRCFFHYIRFPDAEVMRRIVEVMFVDPKWAADDAYIERRWKWSRVPAAWEATAVARFKAPFPKEEDARAERNAIDYGNIRVPTLVIAGKLDPLRNPGYTDGFVPKISNCKLHVFEKAGHMGNIECADEFNRITLDFLKSVDS